MKLVVLGASGGVGRLLVEQAAAAGHDVVAVVRSSSAVPTSFAPSVRVVRANLSDAAALAEAFVGADAVLSALGLKLQGLAPWNKPQDATFLDTSTAAIVSAMKQAGVPRVVAVSSSGIGDSAALLPGFFKVFIAVSAMRHVWPALNRMEAAYANSGLQACCVRPTGLTDGAATGQIVEAHKLVGQSQIARADVAAFMLQEVQKETMRRAVVITTTGAG